MADSSAVEKMLAEATLPPPSKIRKLDLELQAAQSSESEPIQEKKVAYLRDAELWDLLPTKSNKRLKANEPLEEGCAAPFVMELLKDLEKPLDPGRKEEILLKEIRLYLESEGRSDLAKDIKSSRHFEKLPLDLQKSFGDKGWHFNAFNDVGGLDDYQLLCLGRRDKDDDPIAYFCNRVGNTLQSDLLFVDLCERVYWSLQWDDTEYMGFEKAIEFNAFYDSRMKSLTIPWILNVWTTIKNEENKYDQQIELHCQLWNLVVDGKKEFSEALYKLIKRNHDPCIEHDFNSVTKYVRRRLSLKKGWKESVCFLIEEYFEKVKPAWRLDKGYPLYLKKKITKAIQLGIIKKEDEKEFGQVANFLKKIEDTNLDVWNKLDCLYG